MRPLALACVLLFVLALAGAAAADVPHVMSYQGVLKDSTGANVPDGTYGLTLSLYTTSTGGAPVWSETQSVDTSNGVFDVLLGEVAPLPKLLFDQELWLEIMVNYGLPLYPRTQLTTAPYAFRAAVAESLAGGGGPGGDTDWLFNGTGDIYRLTGDVGIGITQPNARLDVVAPSAAYAIQATASDSMNSAGRFVAEGNGVGLIATSQGWGSSLYSLALGTGYAGHFVGGNGVRIDGLCDIDAFQMYPNSTAGHVLTSDGSGVGTWQAPAALPDADWTIDGDDIYLTVPGSVRIGTADSWAKVEVDGGAGQGMRLQSSGEAGYFTIDAENTVGTAGRFATGGAPFGYPGNPVALYAQAGGAHNAGHFHAYDGGDGLRSFAHDGGTAIYANADSAGYAMYGVADGSAYSGYFTGGNGVYVDTSLDVDGPVGIDGKLTVEHDGRTAGYFATTWPGSDGHTIYAYYDVSGPYHAEAVYGHCVPELGYGKGGNFVGGSTGVRGEASTSSSATVGLTGVVGEAYIDLGDTGETIGVQGIADGGAIGVGVSGRSWGGQSAIGVYGVATGGVVETIAGRFTGDVEVSGTLSKGGGSFKIDHPLDPENMYLSHSFVESPDMMNVYNGNVVLDGRGEAVVEMPDWFEVLNRDFRYQLTAIGAPGPNLYISEEMSGGRFTIAGGTPGMKVSWMVTGIRQDKFAEENRIVVEERKRSEDSGKYLHPELYGRAREEGIGYLAPAEDEQDR